LPITSTCAAGLSARSRSAVRLHQPVVGGGAGLHPEHRARHDEQRDQHDRGAAQPRQARDQLEQRDRGGEHRGQHDVVAELLLGRARDHAVHAQQPGEQRQQPDEPAGRPGGERDERPGQRAHPEQQVAGAEPADHADQSGGQARVRGGVEAGLLDHPGHPQHADRLLAREVAEQPVRGDHPEPHQVRQRHRDQHAADRAPGHGALPQPGGHQRQQRERRGHVLGDQREPEHQPGQQLPTGASGARLAVQRAQHQQPADQHRQPGRGLDHRPAVLAEHERVGDQHQPRDQRRPGTRQPAHEKVGDDDGHRAERGVGPAQLEGQVHRVTREPEHPLDQRVQRERQRRVQEERLAAGVRQLPVRDLVGERGVGDLVDEHVVRRAQPQRPQRERQQAQPDGDESRVEYGLALRRHGPVPSAAGEHGGHRATTAAAV
jgi:hypothetical protein